MEHKSQTVIAVHDPINVDNQDLVVVPADNNGCKEAGKRKRGGMNLFKLTLFMMRRRSAKSKGPAIEVASQSMWKRLVGSMRPLHLQSNDLSRKALPSDTNHQADAAVAAPPAMIRQPNSPLREHYGDVFSPPVSPYAASSSDSNSRYASAVNLQELDQSEDQDEIPENVNIYGDDEMIDAKAEEFIAQFYNEMKLQRSDSVNRYDEMTQRALGSD